MAEDNEKIEDNRRDVASQVNLAKDVAASKVSSYSSVGGRSDIGSKILKALLKLLLIPIFPLVLIYNKVKTGQFFPGSDGKISAIIIIVLVVAAIVFALYPLIAAQGTRGIASSLMQALGFARDTAEQATGAYTQQIYRAMGMSYASEIDEYADQDIGVTLSNIRPSQNMYSSSDSVSIWGDIQGKSHSPERALNLTMECWHQKRLSGGEMSERVYGTLRPNLLSISGRSINENFRCEFPQGILSETSYYPDRFNLRATFDFATNAYVTSNFMDYDAYYALQRSDPARVSQIQRQPVAQNTYGPVSIGVGSPQYPILITTDSMQLQPTIGFSITNEWNGYIRNITSFSVMVPRGINLVECDAMTELVRVSSDEFFTNYSLSEEGLLHITSRITVDEDSSRFASKRFVPQNFRCFMEFDPDLMFVGRNRLDPLSLNIFASIEYEYMFAHDVTIATLQDQDDLNIRISPTVVGLSSTPEVVVSEVGLGRNLQSARLTLRHRPRNELESVVVDEFVNVALARDGDNNFVGSITRPLDRLITNLNRGDTVIFEFNVVKSNGESHRSMRAVRILNNPPELTNPQALIFNPANPGAVDEFFCSLSAVDPDGDDVSAIFSIRNLETGQTLRIDTQEVPDEEGVCVKEDGVWGCAAKIGNTFANQGDVVECSVTLTDGISQNRPSTTARATIAQGSSSDPSAPNTPCESTDGLDVGRRGTTTGIDEEGNLVSLTDYCQDENLIVEYYCDNNIVKSATYECTCSNGICLD